MPMKLKAYRAQYGITQLELAKMLGISKQAVHNWECGHTSPTLKHAKKIAEIMNCSIDDIDFFCN